MIVDLALLYRRGIPVQSGMLTRFTRGGFLCRATDRNDIPED